MQSESILILVIPAFVGVALGIFAGWYLAARARATGRAAARAMLQEARQDAESRKKELLVSAQEQLLGMQEEAEGKERELDEREAKIDQRHRRLEKDASDLGRDRKRLDREIAEKTRLTDKARQAAEAAERDRDEAKAALERVAGLTAPEARRELIAGIEEDARREGTRLARKIEDEAREEAEKRAANFMIQAAQRVNIQEVVESTVSFIELPSDEMKGRIIGREGRNIRSLEMATGIDLIVDDTPRSILISSFDPVRREIAHVAINRLVEDGRIHPARIEEVVQRVRDEFDQLVENKGTEAAYGLEISDLHPRLTRLIGEMRYHTHHGQNLLQHCIETALIAGHMARDVEVNVDVCKRAGLLHELGQVDGEGSSHPTLAAAELCAKLGESDEVVHAIRALHPDVEARSVEALLLRSANRMSDQRPGARKENLAVFIERLRRLESIATGFDGVDRAYAVKAGKELRVIIDAKHANDQRAHRLCKEIARAVEKELSYPGQIKVNVVRETRSVRYAV